MLRTGHDNSFAGTTISGDAAKKGDSDAGRCLSLCALAASGDPRGAFVARWRCWRAELTPSAGAMSRARDKARRCGSLCMAWGNNGQQYEALARQHYESRLIMRHINDISAQWASGLTRVRRAGNMTPISRYRINQRRRQNNALQHLRGALTIPTIIIKMMRPDAESS